MSPPGKTNGGPSAGPAIVEKITTATKQHDHRQDSRAGASKPATAAGEWYPPCGRRHLGVVVVRTCPACLHLHLHRSTTPDAAHGTVRTGSCGAVYVLKVRLALPVEIPRVGRRWTA